MTRRLSRIAQNCAFEDRTYSENEMRTDPSRVLEGFDYRVHCADFLLYELGRLIEEEHVSFEDAEFRRLIEEGIHEHLERQLHLRAEIARSLRATRVNSRLLRAIEDIESRLADILEIIQSYTGYLFRRLEECADETPDENVTAAADALFDAPDDRKVARAAVDTLGTNPSAVSARVLAHAISEPMLDEESESRAYGYLREMWPLPRHYILYSLKPHGHEDIPFRWFQLLVECDEPSVVDRIIEEIVVHANDPNYREDLITLLQLLSQTRDPETEDKILQALNSEHTPRAGIKMLEEFLRNNTVGQGAVADEPWARLERVYAANRKYLAAAKLFDSGEKARAERALAELLQDEPHYPFALMLKSLM
jgi:hypothetical protein